MKLFAKPRKARSQWLLPPSKTVAIVVPLSTRPSLDADEEISLRHLLHYLGKYDKFMIAPRNLQVDYPGFQVQRFDDCYFGSAIAHARLQFSPKFYEAFCDYKYILIYHLDALVFSDQLIDWCSRDFDFIGAPWFPCADTPWVEEPRVGNSGFALLKVRSFLRVLYSRRRAVEPQEAWNEIQPSWPPLKRLRGVMRAFRRHSFFRNHVRYHMKEWLSRGWAGDIFWAWEARRYYPEFRIASAEEALPFAFEADPRACHRRNDCTLPFGCHAWGKYDRAFWEPYLLKEKSALAPS
jgi:hypothetical protein